MDLEAKLYRENLKVAEFRKRLYAYLIDELLISFIIFVSFFNSFIETGGDLLKIVEVTISMIFYLILLKTAYHTIFIALYGKTIGKIILKIRVVDIYLLDIPLWQTSCLRALLRNFSEMFFGLGMLFSLTNLFRQTLHDKFSKVIVING